MPCDITGSWETLLDQASMTSNQYFRCALSDIKKELNTEEDVATIGEVRLAIDLAKISASDFLTSLIGVFAGKLADKLSDSLDGIARALGDE
jgi:hypothetical protein